MSTIHRCVKCGSTVFTLESPRANVAGSRVNTGIKLATCMECGNQDRPETVNVGDNGQLENVIKAHEYKKLLNKWRRAFDFYAKGVKDE